MRPDNLANSFVTFTPSLSCSTAHQFKQSKFLPNFSLMISILFISHYSAHSSRIQLYNLSSRILSKNLKIKIYKTTTLPVVLYGCETYSLTLREECKLRVFENRIPGRIFGPKRDENGKWRRLHNEELHCLYRSPNIVRVIKSRRLRWTG